MQKADVILLLGARLNWILHFGKSPRFSPDVKIIQVDICAEELDSNKTVALQGDIGATMQLFMVSSKSFVLFKVNSVQESCAKCFAVHMLKFEILQIT